MFVRSFYSHDSLSGAHPPRDGGRILVTGATGYIGGRLVPRLLDSGYSVRCLVRSPRKLTDRSWATHPNVEIVKADLSATTVEELSGHLARCSAAYYLVHAMISAGAEYVDHDRKMAEKFAKAAELALVGRIIYLGGLGELGAELSQHLASRREVGQVLSRGSVPVTELRAAMIIGSGSASFEILRYLVERLPVMMTPKWVKTECQPIGITNVLVYLIRCLSTPETIGRKLDIGGADSMSYAKLMEIMSEERSLPRRWVIPVPVLTPKLSSLWIHLVTPVGYRISRPLAEGLKNRVTCRTQDAQQLIPQDLLTAREAIRAALLQVREHEVETIWSTAGALLGDPDWAGGTTFVDRRTIDVAARPAEVFRAVCRVGGGHGLVRSRLAMENPRVDRSLRRWTRTSARSTKPRNSLLW